MLGLTFTVEACPLLPKLVPQVNVLIHYLLVEKFRIDDMVIILDFWALSFINIWHLDGMW